MNLYWKGFFQDFGQRIKMDIIGNCYGVDKQTSYNGIKAAKTLESIS